MKKSATFLTLGTIIGIVLEGKFNITGKLCEFGLKVKKKVDDYRSEAESETEFEKPE